MLSKHLPSLVASGGAAGLGRWKESKQDILYILGYMLFSFTLDLSTGPIKTQIFGPKTYPWLIHKVDLYTST